MFWSKKKETYYLKGFDAGFKAAWDWMAPYMKEANEKLVERLYQEAMNKAIDQLEPTIQKRMKDHGH